MSEPIDTCCNDLRCTDCIHDKPANSRPAPVADAEAIARIIDPVAFDPISLNDTHPGWLCRRETALETASAVLALNGRSESAPDVLWCCHVRGPDDVYAAPDYETALAWSDILNALNWEAANSLKIKNPASYADCIIKAAPAPWPHDPEGHALALPTSIAGFAESGIVSPVRTAGGGEVANARAERGGAA